MGAWDSVSAALRGPIEFSLKFQFFSFHALRLPAKAGAQDKLANGKGAKIFKRLEDGRDACVLR